MACNPTNSLERALMSLELISLRPGGFSHTDISRILAIPKSSCTYILSRLERHHYINRDANTHRYEVGQKLVGLAHGVQEEYSTVRRILEPILRELADKIALTVAVGVLSQGNVVLIENIEYCRSKLFNVSVGIEVPFDITSLGNILVAALPLDEMDKIIDRYAFSRRISAAPISKAKLRRELGTIRKQQYATNTRLSGIRSAAVPIYDVAGSVCAGLVASGAASAKAWNGLPLIIEQLRATAQEISDQTRTIDWLRFSSR
jgi:IclR family acetate operon transcriptional repressor